MGLRELYPYKLVFFTKEPVKYIIGVYKRRLKANAPNDLTDKSLEQGLISTAKDVLNTLEIMRGTVAAASGDKKVKLVEMEEFWADYDCAAAVMFDFLFGNASSKNEMLAQAKAKCDKTSTLLELNKDEVTYAQCVAAIQVNSDPV